MSNYKDKVQAQCQFDSTYQHPLRIRLILHAKLQVDQLQFDLLLLRMGNSLLRQTKRQLKSQTFEWSLVGVTPYCTRVIDPNTKILGQKYSIDLAVIQSQWQTYVLRRNHPANLVSIYDLIQQKQNNLCSSNRQAAVIVEYIPYRLSDLGTLSFQEGLCVLKCILEGYKILRQHKIQFYLLDEINICFNQKGKCKFWINQNLYLSKPSSNRIVSEQNFIKGLLEIIQPRMAELSPQYLQKKNKMTTFTMEKLLLLIRSLMNQSSDKIVFLQSTSGLSEAQIKIIKSFTNCNSQEKTKDNKKVSISKYKQQSKRNNRKSDFKFNKITRDKVYGKTLHQSHAPKKVSLSFQWNIQRRRLSHLQNHTYPIDVYFSPRKQMDVTAMHNDNQHERQRQWKAGYYSPPIHNSYQSCIQ